MGKKFGDNKYLLKCYHHDKCETSEGIKEYHDKMKGMPFKFEAIWLLDPSCLDVIHEAWRVPQKGSFASKLCGRLGEVKRALTVFDGRTTLVRSAKPTYAMLTHKLPVGLWEDIDSLMRDFWWGKSEEEAKEKRTLYLKSWDIVCTPKDIAGLGLRKTREYNQALLAKLGWRILMREDKPWASIMMKKYCRNESFLDSKERSRNSPIWKAMLHGRDLLKMGACYRVGDGTKIDLWKEPRVPNLAKIKHKEIRKIQLPLSNVDDRLIWGPTPTRDGNYTVKSGYRTIQNVATKIWNPPPMGWVKINMDASFNEGETVEAALMILQSLTGESSQMQILLMRALVESNRIGFLGLDPWRRSELL